MTTPPKELILHSEELPKCLLFCKGPLKVLQVCCVHGEQWGGAEGFTSQKLSPWKNFYYCIWKSQALNLGEKKQNKTSGVGWGGGEKLGLRDKDFHMHSWK